APVSGGCGESRRAWNRRRAHSAGAGDGFCAAVQEERRRDLLPFRRWGGQPGDVQRSVEHGQPAQGAGIFIVENNGVAMGTQVERHSAEKDLAERGCGFGMPRYCIDGNDVDVVIDEMSKAAARARSGEGPSYIVANTYRFRGHSMSDPMKYRSKEEAEKARKRDPIEVYQRRLSEK